MPSVMRATSGAALAKWASRNILILPSGWGWPSTALAQNNISRNRSEGRSNANSIIDETFQLLGDTDANTIQ